MKVYEVEHAGAKTTVFAPDPKTAAMLAGNRSKPTYTPASYLIRKGSIMNYIIFRTNMGDLVYVMETGDLPCD